jgi:hypothetical protein
MTSDPAILGLVLDEDPLEVAEDIVASVKTFPRVRNWMLVSLRGGGVNWAT